MASWLLLAIFAQFLGAVAVIVDRHIVMKAQHIGKPIVYAFYVGILSSFVVVLIPFGVGLPSLEVLVYSVFYAIAFIAGIYYLYSALTLARASDVAPVIGAVSIISTLVLAHALIDGDVSGFLVPVILLAAGTALISHFHFTRHALLLTALSGIAFGVVALTTKLVFLETTFIDGYFWTRMASVVCAGALLAIPHIRSHVFSGGKRASQGAKMLVLGNKILAGVAAALTAYAISLGSVSVVNALSGLQFAFLFLFALVFAPSMPILREGGKTHGHGGWQTGFGVAVICIGIVLLYV